LLQSLSISIDVAISLDLALSYLPSYTAMPLFPKEVSRVPSPLYFHTLKSILSEFSLEPATKILPESST